MLIEVQKIIVALNNGNRESESERIFCRGACYSEYGTLPVFRKICGALSLMWSAIVLLDESIP